MTGTLSAQVQQKGVWTDPQDETIPAVFHVQGEYVGEIEGGEKIGAQVIALNEDGAVQAVLYRGGLPGAGWDEQRKILLDGKLAGGQIELRPTEGDRKYMDGRPAKFTRPSSFLRKDTKPGAAAFKRVSFPGKPPTAVRLP